jgi:UDP-N-acetylmuramoyl-L-alanyl-D-glutamate--2,6-diaminopimelate ligase
MPLTALMAGVPGKREGPFDERNVVGLVTDSRRVQAGTVFFAMAGTNGHGMQYLDDAVRRGAAAVVVPSGASAPPDVPTLVVPNPESLLAPLAARLYGHPGDQLQLYGVTGTNGKTTTALMMSTLLAAVGMRPGYWTTNEVQVGHAFFRPFWTTPLPPDLQRFLAACVDASAKAAVLEVSSHAVALGRIAGVRFEVGIATNLSPDHLDFHGDVAAYAAAKRSFIHGLDDDRALAVLNVDDPHVWAFREGARARVLGFGTGAAADLRIISVQPQGERLYVRIAIGLAELRPGGERELAFTLAAPGTHNAMNAVAALTAGLGRGFDAATLLGALETFRAPPRRLEIWHIGPYTVTNDVAMNEVSYETVLGWAAASGFEQVVAVCALRGHRGVEVSRAIGRVFAHHAPTLDLAPLIVSLSHDELARMRVDHRVREEEIAAFLAPLREVDVGADVHDNLTAAVDAAVRRLRPGGLLLLLGTFGMDAGPRLAEEALCRRLGREPGPPPPYLTPSYGVFDGERN